MTSYPIVIKPFGEQALLVEWPEMVDEDILYDILRFHNHLKFNHLNDTSWEFVPAYNSLTIIHRSDPVDYNVLRRQLNDWYKERKEGEQTDHFIWRLPVCYDPEFGSDLDEVARMLNKTTEEVVQLHSSVEYTVFGIGFLPGFMYLGGLPETLETPRKDTPRLLVPKGSVGLAGKQTGIYPQDSPGGWNIIGRCPIPIFNGNNPHPCFTRVGDKIQFYTITKGAFDLHKIEAEVGIFKIDKRKWNA